MLVARVALEQRVVSTQRLAAAARTAFQSRVFERRRRDAEIVLQRPAAYWPIASA
jgi:hypothetical protein